MFNMIIMDIMSNMSNLSNGVCLRQLCQIQDGDLEMFPPHEPNGSLLSYSGISLSRSSSSAWYTINLTH